MAQSVKNSIHLYANFINLYIKKYSQFSLFVVVMFYKVTTNTELANTKALLLGEILAWVPASFSSQHFCQAINT